MYAQRRIEGQTSDSSGAEEAELSSAIDCWSSASAAAAAEEAKCLIFVVGLQLIRMGDGKKEDFTKIDSLGGWIGNKNLVGRKISSEQLGVGFIAIGDNNIFLLSEEKEKREYY